MPSGGCDPFAGGDCLGRGVLRPHGLDVVGLKRSQGMTMIAAVCFLERSLD